ncbi:MAG TPA: sigma-70 family RNA polymerase sigma factor [Gaiellaceae bacterium]|nr:sigma-70 family RNA polymerase sigma factor [Gaiellaceae bacterium]
MTSGREPPDAELVRRCRRGDADAWAALVERFSRYVYAIVVQGFRLRDEDAEDVFQDVFAKAYEGLPRLRDDGAVRPWLAQLTRRACIDRLRSARREETAGAELEPPELDETLAGLDEALAVRAALARLSPVCREILDRFFARDESYRTIGGELGLPPGTVASRISRCLERLREELAGRKSGAVASG